MVVQLTDNLGNITYPTSFSVDTTNVWVNYPLIGSPCPSGYTVTLYANTPITQTTSYGQRTPFTATTVGASLNKLTIIDQQLQRQVNQAFTTPVGQSAGIFPSASPGYVLGWNSSNQLANLANPSLTAQWSLNGANIFYNTGSVSTSNNMTATYFNGIHNGSINWPSVTALANSSNLNWQNINGITSINSGAVNWTSLTNVVQATGVNWQSLNSVSGYVPAGGVNWTDVQTQKSIKNLFGSWSTGATSCGGIGSTGCTYGTIYGPVTTDGIVTAWVNTSSNGQLQGLTDSSATPATVRQNVQEIATNPVSVTFPVRKGDYFEVTSSGSVSTSGTYFTSQGS